MPRLTAAFLLAAWVVTVVAGQDLSPLRDSHVWLPMTGMTDVQIDEAAAAGFDTVLLKIAPPVNQAADVDFKATDALIARATGRRLRVILAVFGWAGLGRGEFWDTDASGERIPDRLDPFWHEAMQRVEHYFVQVIDRYRRNPAVSAFAPTWGIYGEGGFTSFSAGRSAHALARFNEWRAMQDLPPLAQLPSRTAGANTEYNRFIRFRYLYVSERFSEMIQRLKQRAGGIPVGTWQELYPVIGYLYNMVKVPSADFALYESCFPFQTTHDPARTLGETMGFRYRCRSASDYRDYYLPLLARKRGEGQRFMGCQLSNDYAVRNYGWSRDMAERVAFDRWEDEFSPYLRDLMAVPLESPRRDVLFVFPTYAAATLSDSIVHSVDTMLIDVLLRMYGCQMVRIGSPELDRLTVAEMDRFRLVVLPCAAYLLGETYDALKRTTATVLFTGCFAQSFDAVHTPFGQRREVGGVALRYHRRPGGQLVVESDHALTGGLSGASALLPEDETFSFEDAGQQASVLMACGDSPLLSIGREGRFIFVHGHLFAGLCHDPERKPPPAVGGSADPSANEIDPWGPHSSTHPQNAVARKLIGNVLEQAGVAYRVPQPPPRRATPYLGDHMEVASISANIVYNNTPEVQTLSVRVPYRPRGYVCAQRGDRYDVEVEIPAFSYVALRPVTDGE